ncbi:MAG: hypothetical protein Q8M76_07000 [Spirochaetaceae bacterium]|nr:hypothetical protein [Spirochaetaceae bacterium]
MQFPSAAAQVIVSIIPIVAIVMGSVVAFFYLLWSHREKVRLIERGQYSPKRFDVDVFSLLAGLLLTSVGIVLTILFVALEGVSYALLGGLLPLASGASLLVFYVLRRSHIGA